MKKQFLTIGTAFMFLTSVVLLTSCGDTTDHSEQEEHEHMESEGGHEHSEGGEHSHGEESDKKVNAEFSGEKVQNLSLILTSYLAMTDALVSDNSEGAAAAAEGMLSSFNGFDSSNLDEEQMSEYNEIVESAMENAEHIFNNATVIDHQREHLVALSVDINDLISLVGTEDKLYTDFCPMANDGEGAIWISNTEAISNPYMGSKMPGCGEIQKEIN